MCDTVLTYVACDFNAKLAAERLFVHANTFHYRLARIEERTGLSARRFGDLLLLVLAIRLRRSAP
jgi:DNA-binding PucR family transcriptional regulator